MIPHEWEKVRGATPAQRMWILRRDGMRCCMHYVEGGRWVRCPNTASLQAHHIVPRGRASLHYPNTFPVNGPENLITLCAMHHIGDGLPNTHDLQYVVHPDNVYARLLFGHQRRSGRRGVNPYELMMKQRETLNRQGIPYWNTAYDLMFARWVQNHNIGYLRGHPYPDQGKWGSRGR
jgi:hypothetical protein